MDTTDLVVKIWNQISKTVCQAQHRIADHMSLWPDPSDCFLKMSPSNSAYEAILDIVAMEFVLPGTRWRYPTYEQRERYARLVRQHRREGHWKIVEVLIQQPQGYYYYVDVLNKNFSPEDIFGNIIPALRRKIASVRCESRKARELRLSRRPVKKPVRRRGYNDKGSLRPSHTWLPDNAYSRPELPPEPEVHFRAPRPHQWIPKTSRGSGMESTEAPSVWAKHFRENYRKMY